uniref:Uncharacterized protein n=1 Tax=Meloidogyne enterolobii TaxID=390850 RepID=A0A6V7WD84_MELEN|nr:unnamed protein product [Meloidogyne enterolobii]
MRLQKANDDEDPFSETRRKNIAERQSQYQLRARKRPISPERADMFVDQTPDSRDRTYAKIMQEQLLTAEKEKIEKELVDKHQSGELRINRQAKGFAPEDTPTENIENTPSQAPRKKRIALSGHAIAADKTPNVAQWDETPAHISALDSTPATDKQWDATLHKLLVAIVGMKRQRNLFGMEE